MELLRIEPGTSSDELPPEPPARPTCHVHKFLVPESLGPKHKFLSTVHGKEIFSLLCLPRQNCVIFRWIDDTLPILRSLQPWYFALKFVRYLYKFDLKVLEWDLKNLSKLSFSKIDKYTLQKCESNPASQHLTVRLQSKGVISTHVLVMSPTATLVLTTIRFILTGNRLLYNRNLLRKKVAEAKRFTPTFDHGRFPEFANAPCTYGYTTARVGARVELASPSLSSRPSYRHYGHSLLCLEFVIRWRVVSRVSSFRIRRAMKHSRQFYVVDQVSSLRLGSDLATRKINFKCKKNKNRTRKMRA